MYQTGQVSLSYSLCNEYFWKRHFFFSRAQPLKPEIKVEGWNVERASANNREVYAIWGNLSQEMNEDADFRGQQYYNREQ